VYKASYSGMLYTPFASIWCTYKGVTNKPKKKDSDMKIDKTTYKDKEENQIGLTADHTSRPDKVLFFADPHFLFFNFESALKVAHFVLPLTLKPKQRQNKKSHFSTYFFNFVLSNSISN